MKINFQELANQAAEIEDQNKVSSGGNFEYTPPPEGKTIGRLIEYVELGMQKQRDYKGKARPDADEVRITFELLHPKKNIKEVEINGETRKIADKITIQLPKKLNDKAKFTGLFKTMKYGREDISHMAQMLGEAFVLTIVHNKSEKNDKVYANIYQDKKWLIEPPFITDPITEEVTDVPVPAPLSELRMFIWKIPTKETWDSLFIDGTRTVKKKDAKGNEIEEERSKNFLQESILRASNFEDSALHQMLLGAGALPDLSELGEAEDEEVEEETAEESEDEAEEEEVEEAPAKKTAAAKAPAKKAAPASTGSKAAPAAKTASPSKGGIEEAVAEKKAEKKAATKAAAPKEDPLKALGLDF